MPNLVNRLLFSEVQREMSRAGSFLVLGLDRLPAEEAHALRGKAQEKGLKLFVLKNRVATKALAAAGHPDLAGLLKGQCALFYGEGEDSAIVAAKILEESMKGRKANQRHLEVLGAVLDGGILPREEAANLHALPGREEVRAMLAGAIQGPLRMLAVAISAPGASLARALKARADGEGAPAP